MSANPFSVAAPSTPAQRAEPARSANLSRSMAFCGMVEEPSAEKEASDRGGRLTRSVCAAAVLFIIVVFFVFREIQHTRELYRMSRMVAAAEAERREWQERLRVAEVRIASLVAEMHGAPLLPLNPSFGDSPLLVSTPSSLDRGRSHRSPSVRRTP